MRAFALAAILAGGVASGQTLPTRLPQPARGEAVVDASGDATLNPVYDDASGRSNELAHSLDLYALQARISYGLSRSFAVGILGSYRVNRYCCLNGNALSDSGLTGGGVFVDWSPGASGGRPNLLRLGYETQRSPDSALLPVSDGQDRVFLRSDWSILGGKAARLGFRLDLDYGRPFEIQKAFLHAGGEIVPQVALLRSRSLAVDVAGTAAFQAASDARENGTIFHNRRSTSARAGLELDLGLGRQRRQEIFLDVRHDFAASNALNGWRFGLTFRRRLGP